MKDEARNLRRNLLWALSASLILHGLIIALLIYRLPKPPEQPSEEQAVDVALVPPKPAPAPPPQQAKTEKPPEPKVEKLKPQEKAPTGPSPVEVLKPVFQYSDKDTGPRKSLDGSSEQDGSPAASNDAEPRQDKQEAGKQAAIEDSDKVAAAPMASADSDAEIALPTSSQVPQPRPQNGLAKVSKPVSGGLAQPSSKDAAVATLKGSSSLPGVRRAYSQNATGDALATTSMAGVSRNQRASKLCTSALEQKLTETSYRPALVPLVPLYAGNVLDVPDTAFRTRTGWYNLGFRCEVDTNATKVLSFAFRVGTAIPPDEWAGLGLPMAY
ncbi:MAG: DUF930 domain-containing protein [Mesorhizobium sp.]